MAITTVDLGNVRGSAGAEGKSAYEVAVAGGFSGSQAAWVASLKGAQGAQGVKGDTGARGATGGVGATGAKGADGLTTSVNGVAQVNGNVALTGANIPLSGTDAQKLDGVIGGKLSKADVVNDLVTTVAGKALDARQGKVLGDWHDEAMTMLNGRTLKPTLLLNCNWNSGSVTVQGSDRYHVFLIDMEGWRPAIAIKNPRGTDVENMFVFACHATPTELTLSSYYISYFGLVWTIPESSWKGLQMTAAGAVKSVFVAPITHIYGLL
ncbi:MAG: hypothetical protein RR816_14585 [Clostridia bacterium]